MEKLKKVAIVSKLVGDYMLRVFLRKSILLGMFAGIVGIILLIGCKNKMEENSPVESLMREHALLSRVMIIYDHCNNQISNNEPLDRESLANAALIIKEYIEDYHEKLEEKYLFPLIVNANKLQGQVQLLFIQHAEGRKLTMQIIKVTQENSGNRDELMKLSVLLTKFNTMYRSHAAREDTEVFYILKEFASNKQYCEMKEKFDKKEIEQFGTKGFDVMLNKVMAIEKNLGIFELSEFTTVL